MNNIRDIIDEAKQRGDSARLDEVIIKLEDYHKRLGVQEKETRMFRLALLGGVADGGEIKTGFLQEIKNDFANLKVEIMTVAKICRDCTAEKITQKKNRIDWWKWIERTVIASFIGYLFTKIPH